MAPGQRGRRPCREARRGTRPMPASCTDSASRPRRARETRARSSRSALATRVDQLAIGEGRVGRRKREHVGKDPRAQVLEGDSQRHRPWLPPPSEGDADSSSPCRPSNGCGRRREVQSIKFLRVPAWSGCIRRGDDERIARDEPSPELERPCGTPAPSWRSRRRADVEVAHRCSIDVGPERSAMRATARRAFGSATRGAATPREPVR